MHKHSIKYVALITIVAVCTLLGALYVLALNAPASKTETSNKSNDLDALLHTLQSYDTSHTSTKSIYLQEMTSSRSLAINADSSYNAASLFKLPVVMQLYKEKELGKVSMTDQYKLQPEDIDKRYGELWKKGAGYSLSFENAAELSIVNSDNTAARAITSFIKTVDTPEDDFILKIDQDHKFFISKDEVKLSPRSYSSIISCLYQACFNDQKDSQAILSLMSQTVISPMRAGTSNTAVVADKFGIFVNNDGTENFNDCGLVTSKAIDYVLCTMIVGPIGRTYQQQVDISKIVSDFYNR